MEFERIYEEKETQNLVLDSMCDKHYSEYQIHKTEEKEQIIAYCLLRSRYNIVYANRHFAELLKLGVQELNIEEVVNVLEIACKKAKVSNIKKLILEEDMDLREEEISSFSLQNVIRGLNDDVVGIVYYSGVMLSSNLLTENEWYKVKLYLDGLKDSERIFDIDIIPQKLNYMNIEGYVTVLITDTTKAYERVEK